MKYNSLIGFTCGAFDLLHPGHLAFLEECKKDCDELWIGLHTDPTIDRPDTKEKPVQSMFERFIQINCLNFVSNIIPYDTELDLENMMAILPIKKRFVGSEYTGIKLTGQDICEHRKIQIVFIDRLHKYSSSTLRNKIRGK
jgi:glycerol-3-phosphate cytidylyltransferase